MSDTSLFVKVQNSDVTYVLIYVNDIIVTGNNSTFISSLLTQLQTKFALKDLGDLHFSLGIEVFRDESGLFLSQKKYALEKFLLKQACLTASQPYPLLLQNPLHQLSFSLLLRMFTFIDLLWDHYNI